MENAGTIYPPYGGQTGFLPNGIVIAEFKPFAFFDSYMDCIRVMTLDRSVTEVRIDDFLTLYRTNHASPFEPQYCGFCLKGIRHWFNQLELEPGAELMLADLIDRIVKRSPQSTIAKILADFPATQLQVEWPKQAEAA